MKFLEVFAGQGLAYLPVPTDHEGNGPVAGPSNGEWHEKRWERQPSTNTQPTEPAHGLSTVPPSKINRGVSTVGNTERVIPIRLDDFLA